ncbi:hypothetical protein Taro_044821 [Colocasia esculenta]|uniref:FAE domain-containing protein n=1 Tax=Colocasia esculenta TaxID=4460 RepID=A0A843WZ10_COLES|nr:hypothetical protein [Colocasia esculenta]
MVIFSAVDALFQRTGLRAKDVDILILNCILFSPTPSLSGMGCSAGLISIDLACRDLLQVHPNSNAVVVSTEIITPNWVAGNQRSMLLPNCLFRMGAAAILLSNRRRDRSRAKYRLVHVVRTHKGADNKAYRCVYEEDAQGNSGISLSKDLVAIAGEALKSNITTIGPLVLPVSEQLLFLLTLIARRIFHRNVRPYILDFKQSFEHFCIHVDELQKNLDFDAAASDGGEANSTSPVAMGDLACVPVAAGVDALVVAYVLVAGVHATSLGVGGTSALTGAAAGERPPTGELE